MVIGITGNTGSGKTIIAGFFKQWGGYVISADRMGWEVLLDDKVIEKLRGIFGDGIVKDGKVDRKKLGDFVFEDQEQLLKFNKIVHPALLLELRETIKNCKKDIVIVDAALILEWGIKDWFDYIILVSSKLSIIHPRLKRLGIPEEVIQGRIKFQMDSGEAKGYADFIIENNGSIKKLRLEARNIWEKIVKEKNRK
ncbi:dephospho-CoA kinase [candidate division WOR-3 bacterium]|nr:dephospho-CoA kinase [candidate division WOR-3 bacterium]